MRPKILLLRVILISVQAYLIIFLNLNQFTNNSTDNSSLIMHNKHSAVAEMGNRLVTIDIGRKDGADVPLSEVGEGEGSWIRNPHLIQCGLD